METQKRLFFLAYLKFENRVFKVSPDAFAEKNLKELLNCAVLEVVPKQTRFSDRIIKEDLEIIKEHHIDVFIRGGFNILRGAILKSAKYRIWSYHHGDNNVNRGGPAGVWEVLENWKEIGVILQILTENLDGGIKLYESFSSTDYLSIKRNRNEFYWKAISFIPRKLRELHRDGEEKFFQKINERNAAPQFYYNRLFKGPGNLQLLKYIVRNYWNAFKVKIVRQFYFNQWILLFKIEKRKEISQSFFRFKRILPPKDRLWADPFVVFRDNKYFLFIEEYLYKENKGKIAVIEMDDAGNFEKPQLVLEKEYHLSYPFIIQDDNEYYYNSPKNRRIKQLNCIIAGNSL